MNDLTATKGRDNNFNMIRMLAAYFVVAGHMFVLNGESAPSVYGHAIHSIGVYIFFFLGGILSHRVGLVATIL